MSIIKLNIFYINMDKESINLTEILNIDDIDVPVNDMNNVHNHYLLTSNMHKRTSVRKNLNDLFSHATLLSNSITENNHQLSQVLADNNINEPLQFQFTKLKDSDDIECIHLKHKLSELSSEIQKSEKRMSDLKTQNLILSTQIVTGGDSNQLKRLLMKEINQLQIKNETLKQTMNSERKTNQQKLNKLNSELKNHVTSDEIPSDVTLSVISEEYIKLKQEKLRLQKLFDINGSKRKESENIVHEMDLETMERDVEDIRDKALQLERFKLRPLSLQLIMLKQKHQDLVWAIDDRQILQDKNKECVQLMDMQTQQLKELEQVNMCYREKIVSYERDIEMKNNAVETISVGNHKLRKDTQDLMQSHTNSLSSIRATHGNEIRNLRKELCNITQQYEELQTKDKHWKQYIVENIEYIHKWTGRNMSEDIQNDLEKIKIIDVDLKTMRYFMIGLHNIVDKVERDTSTTNTMDIMAMINNEKPKPPRPPSVAVSESIDRNYGGQNIAQKILMFDSPKT
eukprot:308258_1